MRNLHLLAVAPLGFDVWPTRRRPCVQHAPHGVRVIADELPLRDPWPLIPNQVRTGHELAARLGEQCVAKAQRVRRGEGDDAANGGGMQDRRAPGAVTAPVVSDDDRVASTE